MHIEPFDPSRLDDIVALSLRAWAPVFDSLRDVFGPALFETFYGDDWRTAQAKAVADVCADDAVRTWVAIEDADTAGFVAARLRAEERMGEIWMIAVDPLFQRRGIAAALTDRALEWFREAGMEVAMVETGGDPGHAPARRAYEASGFRLFPVARYFKAL